MTLARKYVSATCVSLVLSMDVKRTFGTHFTVCLPALFSTKKHFTLVLQVERLSRTKNYTVDKYRDMVQSMLTAPLRHESTNILKVGHLRQCVGGRYFMCRQKKKNIVLLFLHVCIGLETVSSVGAFFKFCKKNFTM